MAGRKKMPNNSQLEIAAAAAELANSAEKIIIEGPTQLSIALEIQGTAPLIQNKFSQKAVEMMLRKHMGMSTARESKKPREILDEATIRNTDGRVCIPPTAIKKAMISAASQIKGLKKTDLRIALFIQGQSIPITFKETLPRMDMVRTSGIGRVPDVRFRPSFQEWSARLCILYSDHLSVQSVIDLLHRAGKVGVGEWRPERSGDFGTFKVVRHISDVREMAQVELECAAPLIPLTIPSWALDAEISPEILERIFSEQGGPETRQAALDEGVPKEKPKRRGRITMEPESETEGQPPRRSRRVA